MVKKLSGASTAAMESQLKTEPGKIASNATTMIYGLTETLISRTGSVLTEKGGEVEMTNQEAIETIEANYPPENYSMLREALDMAIALLKEKEEQEEREYREKHPCEFCQEYLCDGCTYCADGERKEQ